MKRVIPLTRERRSRQGLADRTMSKHPIRSTMVVPRLRILAIAAAALTSIALILVASGKAAVAFTALVNGNFETGDLTGWTVDTTSFGGAASADASYDYYYQVYCTPENSYGGPCFDVQTMRPKEGSYFALLKSGTPTEYTKISQPFKASNGDKVSGWAFFDTESFLPYDDKAQVVVKSAAGTTVATLFEESVSSVGYSGNSGWKYWEHTFTDLTGEGEFQMEARVGSVAFYEMDHLGLDDVKISTLGPDTTKPSTSATRSVEPNAAGWNKEDVSVKLNATDNQGGWGVKKITYSASGAQTIANTDASGSSADVNLNAEGTTTLTYHATDKAGNVEAPKTLTVKIDKTAPKVSSVRPASGATNVARNTSVTGTFSEKMDPATLTTSTVTLVKSGTTISTKVSYNDSTKTVTLTPSSNLQAKTKYTVNMSGGVKDLAGNELAPYTWGFTTGNK
jgi:hypothetical protein